jgi:hypothetical protein
LDHGAQRQVIGGDARPAAPVRAHLRERAGRLHPDAIELEERCEGGIRAHRARLPEVIVELFEQPSRHPPLVEVAEQHGEIRVVLARQALEELPALRDALARLEAEMRRDDADPRGVPQHLGVDRAARLAARLAQVDQPQLLHRQARQESVAVGAGRPRVRRSVQELVAAAACEHRELVALRMLRARVHLLDRDDVRAELVDHLGHALRAPARIDAHAAVHVVRGDHELARVARAVAYRRLAHARSAA